MSGPSPSPTLLMLRREQGEPRSTHRAAPRPPQTPQVQTTKPTKTDAAPSCPLCPSWLILPADHSRAAPYLAADASGTFVPGPADEAVIAALADGVKAPLNIMLRHLRPSASPPASLATAPFPRRIRRAGGGAAGLSGDGNVRVVRRAGGGAGFGCGVCGKVSGSDASQK